MLRVVGAAATPLRPVNTSEALHALLRREGFAETAARDTHPDCADWAYKGQCHTNPGYMRRTCAKACADVEPDTDPRCGAWAADGQCTANAPFMSAECARSCRGVAGADAREL